MWKVDEEIDLDNLAKLSAVYAKLTGATWFQIDSHPILLLSGKMGSGKTTFTRYFVESLAEYFAIKKEDGFPNVNSPTYTILNEYLFPEVKNGAGESLKVTHFDLYRIGSETEFDELGFEEIWAKPGISLVEWWEKSGGFFKTYPFRIRLVFEEVSDEKRKISGFLEGEGWSRPELKKLLKEVA
ncbi:tRNA (adenosine(37)-N6)-threonylcarbamoyltransferase complex ATPase subunit type 1 TsaE [Leptospira perolatii]|uniref:tRNA threonylcarbamoyladenosine biosynthesis protein TsaE n=1 Tax=Leptospira perolatii TaxID=2023191 RepID=A0A2M9ZRC5_9LEPT|nr:tRNA (adenosine(37)-N6)-threonylcarbamoyltransferase complex ATPase subunit type 1 TsaE [Leptospira perolatii]PJZ71053.1 tRNA (adenosine(37)-N6)-threonylcarbamoyltransferase complex ATPase subunit type 1 TsaE [Leptospira perolatii]PJZ74585.1 tRNA (adenosine(37)-N6)-threonylcarbamoyltransferase complex ATPase subunit type 1 TsaE [Leptospira perolatii]